MGLLFLLFHSATARLLSSSLDLSGPSQNLLEDPTKGTKPGRGAALELFTMTLLCYNKGCGQRFDADENRDGEIAPPTLVLQRACSC